MARRANDLLAEEVQKRPDRFQAFAALPMQDPELAIAELERCVKELGFRGALVNGFSQVGEPDNAVYYDLPQYRPFWAAVERLDVPFYLHPRSPLPRDARLYAGHPWLMGAAWGYGNETAVHALRLIGCGLFDEFPRLSVVIGHMGEGIPFNLWRLDNCNAGVEKADPQSGQEEDRRLLQREFLRHHVRQLQQQRVDRHDPGDRRRPGHVLGRLAVRADRTSRRAGSTQAAISDIDRRKIGRDNALRLLKL